MKDSFGNTIFVGDSLDGTAIPERRALVLAIGINDRGFEYARLCPLGWRLQDCHPLPMHHWDATQRAMDRSHWRKGALG